MNKFTDYQIEKERETEGYFRSVVADDETGSVQLMRGRIGN